MPYYRLIDTEAKEILMIRRMSHDTARHLNGTLDEGQEWKAGLDGGRGDPL